MVGRGQVERLIPLFKAAFYKTIGNGTHCWAELEEVVLDVEVALNNPPLRYLEDGQLPVLTPYSMLHINSSDLPKMQPHHPSSRACSSASVPLGANTIPAELYA